MQSRGVFDQSVQSGGDDHGQPRRGEDLGRGETRVAQEEPADIVSLDGTTGVRSA